jgi:hypothetical protein
MKRILFTIAAVGVLSASANAQGFTPDSVRDFFRKKAPAGRSSTQTAEAGPNVVEELLLVELWGKATQFRKLAVDKPKLDAWKRSALVRPGALDRLEQGKITPVYRELWNWVLMGSQVVAGSTMSDAPVVAFYNPFIDAALLTTWTHVDDKGWKMADAVPVTGAAFVARRASRDGDRPGYGKGAALEEGIVANSRRFIASFEAQYPPFGRQNRGVAAGEAGTRAALKYIEEGSYALIGMLASSEGAAQVEVRSIHRAMTERTSDTLSLMVGAGSPLSAEGYFRLSQRTREQMTPYFSVGGVTLSVDPESLDGFASLRLDGGSQSRAGAALGYFSFSK